MILKQKGYNMKELRELINKYGMDKVVDELSMFLPEEQTIENYGSPCSSFINEDEGQIDILEELKLLDRVSVLKSVSKKEEEYYLSNKKIRFVTIKTGTHRDKIFMYVGTDIIKGTMKTDILISLMDLDNNIVPLGGDKWTMFKWNNMIVSFDTETHMSSIKPYDAKRRYYGMIHKVDGSRRNYHQYLSLNKNRLKDYHPVYGSQSAGLGSLYDTEVFNAYEEAKEIVEYYEKELRWISY